MTISRILLGAALFSLPLIGMAQITIEPPPAQPETTQPAPTTKPVDPAATQPERTPPASAEKVLEGLLGQRPAANPVIPPSETKDTVAAPVTDAVAPNQPQVQRVREGQFIYNRTGRLVKDDKSGTFLFTFDGDGKDMRDPPMAVLPSRLLMAMEEASDKGNKPTKFKISGEVTEYRGKNFLLIRYMQTVKDLNQGLGG